MPLNTQNEVTTTTTTVWNTLPLITRLLYLINECVVNMACFATVVERKMEGGGATMGRLNGLVVPKWFHRVFHWEMRG